MLTQTVHSGLGFALLLASTGVPVVPRVPGGTDPAAAAEGPVWPLDPRPAVVDGFAPPAERWGPGHRGVDLAGRDGQPVRTAQAGTVTFAGSLAGRGVVVVDHGDRRTTYEPVTATVTVGDVVSAGSLLGTLQTFGSHCWPATCLHWGLLDGDDYLDPLTLVGAGPVRLLPLHGYLPGESPPVMPAGVPGGTPAATGPW